MLQDSYKTIEKESNDEYIEKRSRFIGYCKPVKTEDDAVNFINDIKAKNWNARHNVYAYCLQEGQIKRYSDDGEPQGTAGVPVLDVILKNGLTDIVIVVTRYFGGILLGTGGLVRAYSVSAKKVIEKSGIITMKKCQVCSIICDYNQYGKISSIIPQTGGVISNSKFSSNVEIEFYIQIDKLEFLKKSLSDITSGKVTPTEEFVDYFSVK